MRLAGLLDDLRPGSESNGPPPVLQTKDETLTSSPPNTTRAGTMREILDLLSINNDQLIGDLASFWREVALVVGAQPEQGLIDSGRAVLDLLSNWDEDFLSENGAELADAAYTDLLSAINERTNFGAQPWGEIDQQVELDVEEDDDDSTEWTAFSVGVGQQAQPDVKTLLGYVYENQLVVNPEWQRNFVWNLKKQRRFIESILMGLPIPSLLMFEDPETNQRFVIDGRQRLETLARYCAIPEQRKNLPFLGKRFKTFSPAEPSWRPGQALNTSANKYYDQLPAASKIKIDQTPVTVFTFKALQPRQLYQIFQRYNTGGEKLRAAEIRNAVYQAKNLHKMLWRLCGESPDKLPYVDEDERYVAETLRNVMRNKTARYGTYDFVGRVMAFAHLDNGKTVATATNDFMDQFEGEDHEAIRREFIQAFLKVLDWYPFPLCTPSQDGKFHSFLATIQLVTAHQALKAIADGTLSENQVESAISGGWFSFAEATLDMKQNSGAFWQRQKDWWNQIKSTATRA